MHEVFFAGPPNNIYRAGYKIADVPILAGQARPLTFYTQHGDLFGWACVAFSVAFPISRWIIGLPRKRTTPRTASE